MGVSKPLSSLFRGRLAFRSLVIRQAVFVIAMVPAGLCHGLLFRWLFFDLRVWEPERLGPLGSFVRLMQGDFREFNFHFLGLLFALPLYAAIVGLPGASRPLRRLPAILLPLLAAAGFGMAYAFAWPTGRFQLPLFGAQLAVFLVCGALVFGVVWIATAGVEAWGGGDGPRPRLALYAGVTLGLFAGARLVGTFAAVQALGLQGENTLWALFPLLAWLIEALVVVALGAASAIWVHRKTSNAVGLPSP